MTSAISKNNNENNTNRKYLANFFNCDLFINNLKRNKIFMIIIGIVLTCACPLLGYISMFYGGYKIDIAQGLVIMITFSAFGFALILGLHAMNYTHDKTSAIFYNSLPIKKTCFFTTQFLSGIVYFIIPLAVVYIPTVILFISDGQAFETLTLGFICAALLFLMAYSFTVFASNISGNRFNSIIVLVYLNLYVLICSVMVGFFIQHFYHFTSSSLFFSMEFLTKTSPFIYFIAKILAKGWIIDFLTVLEILLVSIAFYAASMFLNKINKTENAGNSINFKIFERIFKYSMLTLMALVGGVIFAMSHNSSGDGYGMFILGILIFSFITFMIMNFIINGNIRETFKGLKNYCIFAVVICIILSVFSFDIFGVDKHMPDVNSVDSVTFDYYGNPMYECYFWGTKGYGAYSSSFYRVAVEESTTKMLSPHSITVEESTTKTIIHDIFKLAMKAENVNNYSEYSPLRHDNTSLGLRVYNNDIIFNRSNGSAVRKRLPYNLTFKNQQDYDEYYALIDKLHADTGWRKTIFTPIFDDGYLEFLSSSDVQIEQIELNVRYRPDTDYNPYYTADGIVLLEQNINVSQLGEIFSNARKDILTLSNNDIISDKIYPYFIEITVRYPDLADNIISKHYHQLPSHQFYLGVDENNGKFNFENLMNYLEITVK